MSTPVLKRRIPRLAIIGIIAFLIIGLLYGIFLSPLSPFHICTLIGCRDALEISLTHEPPEKYTIVVTTGDGETRSVTCTPGESNYTEDMTALCHAGVVSFYNFIPSTMKVEINWQSGTYITSAYPVFETLRPNGPQCPPACRVGRTTIQLP